MHAFASVFFRQFGQVSKGQVKTIRCPECEPGNYRIRAAVTASSWDFVRRYETVCNDCLVVVS